MRVFGCARKIGSNGKLFLLIVKYALWSYKSISVFFYLPITSETHRRVKRERERERRTHKRRRRRSSKIEPQPQTQRQDRAPTPNAEARLRRRVCGAKFSVRIVLVLNPKLIGAADLVILISSHQWSCRLNLLFVSLSLKFSITLSSSLSQFDQICMKFNELFWADFCFFKVYILTFL